MTLTELVHRTRSCRRFDQSHTVAMDELVELIALARHTASAGNKQPLKYFLSATPETNAAIYDHLAWAGYLPDWPGPAEGERPTAYIVLMVDQDITSDHWCDDGIAAQTIMLGATEKGLGGCIFGAVQRARLRVRLAIPEHLKIRLVIALGKPIEQVVVDDVEPGGDIRYWRDEGQVHHVPKRGLDELIWGKG